jgi:hypothetical protein
VKKAKKDIYIYMYHYVNPCNFLFEELSGIRVRILLRAVDCLDEVLKVYESGEIAKYFALIEIMNKKGKDFSNSLKIRNCLLLLINLCFEIKNPDYLFNKGKLKDDLSEHEKSQFFEILKCEFNIQ